MVPITGCAVMLDDFYYAETNNTTYSTDTNSSETTTTKSTVSTTTQSTTNITTVESSSTNVNQPPTITIITPENNEVVSSSFLVFGSAWDDHGINSIHLSLDGGEPIPVSGSTEWSYGLNNIPIGTHTIQVTVTDGAGLTSLFSITLSVASEIVDPTLAITSVVANDFLPADFILSGIADDNDSLDHIEVSLDGGIFETASGLQNWTYSFSGLTEGYHFIQVKAVDESGNTAVDGVNIQVDTTNPLISITSHAGGEDVTGVIPIEGTFQDLFEDFGSLVNTIEVCVTSTGDCTGLWETGSITVEESITVPGTWGYNWDTSGLANGTYSIYVRAIDYVGNSSTEATVDLYKTTGWTTFLAGGLSSSNDAQDSDITGDGENTYITYVENSSGFWNVSVRGIVSGSWKSFGQNLNRNSSKDASQPKVGAITGAIYVAWREKHISNNHWQIYASKYNGSTWEDLGGSLNINTGNDAYNPDLEMCIDVTPYPLVCWEENSTVYCKRWTGSTWVSMGAVHGSYYTYEPEIHFQDVVPYVVVRRRDCCGWYNAITVKYWDSGQWSSYEGNVISNGSIYYYSPSLTFDDSGYPIVSYYYSNAGFNNIYVRAWNGSAWASLGGSLNENALNDASNAMVRFGNTKTFISFSEDNGTAMQVYVKEWNGSVWSLMNGGTSFNSNPTQPATNPCLYYGNQMFLLGFDETYPPQNIYLKNY
jgi:hypothetical protein